MSDLHAAARALVSDWQANGNSRPLGDPTVDTWHQAATQLLDALDEHPPADLPVATGNAGTEVHRRSPLDPKRKSGHYVSDPEGPCWCRDVHYYATSAAGSSPEAAGTEDHDFLPVNGHPDDDECTFRADGTDATYCGQPRAAHDQDPEDAGASVLAQRDAEVGAKALERLADGPIPVGVQNVKAWLRDRARGLRQGVDRGE